MKALTIEKLDYGVTLRWLMYLLKDVDNTLSEVIWTQFFQHLQELSGSIWVLG